MTLLTAERFQSGFRSGASQPSGGGWESLNYFNLVSWL
jgi:hypothetical protein